MTKHTTPRPTRKHRIPEALRVVSEAELFTDLTDDDDIQRWIDQQEQVQREAVLSALRDVKVRQLAKTAMVEIKTGNSFDAMGMLDDIIALTLSELDPRFNVNHDDLAFGRFLARA